MRASRFQGPCNSEAGADNLAWVVWRIYFEGMNIDLVLRSYHVSHRSVRTILTGYSVYPQFAGSDKIPEMTVCHIRDSGKSRDQLTAY